jgi:hypothetical protein
MDFALNGTSFKPSARNALLDTGTSMILLHHPDWVKAINAVCDWVDAQFSDSEATSKPIKCKHTGSGFVTITNCDTGCVKRMPKIELQIDSVVYQVRAQNYLRAVTPTPRVLFDEHQKSYKLQYYATFRIFPTLKKQWILGSPFLADYYQVYSLDRNQVGLVPSVHANADPEVLAVVAPWSRDDASSQALELASCLGAIVLTILIRNTCL